MSISSPALFGRIARQVFTAVGRIVRQGFSCRWAAGVSADGEHRLWWVAGSGERRTPGAEARAEAGRLGETLTSPPLPYSPPHRRLSSCGRRRLREGSRSREERQDAAVGQSGGPVGPHQTEMRTHRATVQGSPDCRWPGSKRRTLASHGEGGVVRCLWSGGQGAGIGWCVGPSGGHLSVTALSSLACRFSSICCCLNLPPPAPARTSPPAPPAPISPGTCHGAPWERGDGPE